MVGNWHQPDIPTFLGTVELAVGLVGIALIVWPGRRLLLVGSALAVVSVLGEIPRLGNHWLLAGLGGMAILLHRGRGESLGTTLRWIFVSFYIFAAFAKLNEGFLDPTTSCAVFYANQSLTSWGIATINPLIGPASTVVGLTLLTELSVVPLLFWRRSRWFGVLLASLFHGVISLDLSQHFYDFTAVLFFFLSWFVEPGVQPRRQTDGLVRWLLAPLAILLVVLSVLPPTEESVRIITIGAFLLWIPFLIYWMTLVWRRRDSRQVRWRIAPAGMLVIALAGLNGLTPYTELKTAYGFNMYSNLVTANGRTNHLLVPQTFPLRDGYRGPVQIVRSSDPGLDLYRERGYLIAYPEFQRYLVGRDVAVTYIRNGVTTNVANTQDVEGLANPGPWWWRYMPLRALDVQSPPRCQDVFLPAL